MSPPIMRRAKGMTQRSTALSVPKMKSSNTSPNTRKRARPARKPRRPARLRLSELEICPYMYVPAPAPAMTSAQAYAQASMRPVMLRTSRMRPVTVTMEPGTAREPLPIRLVKAMNRRMMPGMMTKNGHPKACRLSAGPMRNTNPSSTRPMPMPMSRCFIRPYLLYRSVTVSRGWRPGVVRDPREKRSAGQVAHLRCAAVLGHERVHGGLGVQESVLDEDVGRTVAEPGGADDVQAGHVALEGDRIQLSGLGGGVYLDAGGGEELGAGAVAGEGEDAVSGDVERVAQLADGDVLRGDAGDHGLEVCGDGPLLDAVLEVGFDPVLEAVPQRLAAVHQRYLGAAAVQVQRGVRGAGAGADDDHVAAHVGVRLVVVVRYVG